jgi:galactokinase
MRLLLAFQQAYPEITPDWLVQAPGREMWVAAVADPGDLFTLALPDADVRTSFNPRSARLRSTILQRPLPVWARYPAGVVVLLRADGLAQQGVRAVLTGSEPPGPRYDHALGMAMAALLYEMQRLPYTADTLFEIVEQVRRDYVEA